MDNASSLVGACAASACGWKQHATFVCDATLMKAGPVCHLPDSCKYRYTRKLSSSEVIAIARLEPTT